MVYGRSASQTTHAAAESKVQNFPSGVMPLAEEG